MFHLALSMSTGIVPVWF